MSSNLLKSSWFVCKQEDTRVIDSNELIAQKLEKIATVMQETPAVGSGLQGFSQGLSAEQVSALLEDGESSEGAGGLLKAQPVYEGPSPEELIAQAQAEIEQMKDQARQEAERIKQDAFEKGQREGYDAGYQAAMTEGQKQINEERAQLNQQEVRLAQEYDSMVQQLEPLLVDRITAIYEQVFGYGLKDYHEIVLHLLCTTLQNVESGRDFIIHVSRKDYPYVEEHRQEIMNYVGGGNSTMEIIEDFTLAEGECFIETGGGIFDCSLGTELEELGKELRLLSFEGK